MNLVQRVQDILLRPASTWPQIEAESTDIVELYKSYVGILALIPAVAGFIGTSIIGMPIAWGLVTLVINYVLSLAVVYVLALIIDVLAPNFNSTQDRLAAFKLSGYAYTASFVAAIFSIIPRLAGLGLLLGLYSIYLIYTGLPVLMKCPEDKVVIYTVVTALCYVVMAGVLSVVAY